MAVAVTEPYLPPENPRRATPLFTGLVLATIGVLLAGLVSVAALTSASATNSPEDAVSNLMRATASGDVTAALGAIDPNEANAIKPALTAIVGDLQKLGVLNSSLNLSNVTGLSAAFNNVTMATAAVDPSRSDLAAVTLTGGTVTTRADVAQLALGSLLKNVLNGRAQTLNKTSPLVEPGKPAFPIVTVNRDGQWYVSLGYTAAEAARRHAGMAFPTAASAIAPSGGSSPEDAVRQLVTAAVQHDPRKVIALLDPLDAAALHDYGSVLLTHVPTDTSHPVTISKLDLSTSAVPDATMVTVTAFTASDGATTVSLAPGGCLQITSPAAPRQVCAPAGSNVAAGLGVVTVQRGASWYVDPYRTVLDDLDRALSGADLGNVIKQLTAGGAGPLGLFGLPSAVATSGVTCAAPAALGAPDLSSCSAPSPLP